MLLTCPLLTISYLAITAATRPLAPEVFSRTSTIADGRCTFLLWQRQQESTNYVQLNKILDHANDMTIDVALQRPTTAFNSYTRIDQSHELAVTGLLDDESLTISSAGQGELIFDVGGVKWSSIDAYEGRRDGEEWKVAWCDASAWEGISARRVRLDDKERTIADKKTGAEARLLFPL